MKRKRRSRQALNVDNLSEDEDEEVEIETKQDNDDEYGRLDISGFRRRRRRRKYGWSSSKGRPCYFLVFIKKIVKSFLEVYIKLINRHN